MQTKQIFERIYKNEVSKFRKNLLKETFVEIPLNALNDLLRFKFVIFLLDIYYFIQALLNLPFLYFASFTKNKKPSSLIILKSYLVTIENLKLHEDNLEEKQTKKARFIRNSAKTISQALEKGIQNKDPYYLAIILSHFYPDIYDIYSFEDLAQNALTIITANENN